MKIKYYCGWHYDIYSKLIPDASSFEFSVEAIENIRKKEFETACGSDAKLRYELLDFYYHHEGDDFKTGEKYFTPYLASKVGSTKSVIDRMRTEYLLRRRRTPANIETCIVSARGVRFLNEYSFYHTDRFTWEKTVTDKEELRYMAKIPDIAESDAAFQSSDPVSASESAAELDRLSKEVYTFISDNGRKMELNDICLGFPNENRGRIKSVLYNMCNDGLIIKENGAADDIYIIP